MPRTDLRKLLLASAAALALPAAVAQAQTVLVTGGGASLPAIDYAGPGVPTNPTPTSPSEEASFNAGAAPVALQYYYASSGRGQTAFSTDNAGAFQFPGVTSGSVQYAASDAFLAPSGSTFPQTINGFTFNSPTSVTYPLVSTQDGAFIQIPMLGIGITIPAASGNSAISANGKLGLTDADVCGIFSGTISDWGSISHPVSGLTGGINVYFRGDSSGTSFLFTNHLKYACTTGFNAAQLAVMPTTTFANLFANSGNPSLPALPSNFHAETGSAGVAESLAGTVTTSGGSTVDNAGDPQGIGYLSPDYTAISTAGKANDIAATAPDAGFINSKVLYTAGIEAAGSTKFLTPTTGNISTGLGHPGAHSTNPKPPATVAKASNPLNWVPSVPLVKSGYPIVGYTNWLLAQCYNSSSVSGGLVSFLTNHYAGTYKSTIANNGFVVPGTSIGTAVNKYFLTSSSSLAIAPAGTAGTCASVSGR